MYQLLCPFAFLEERILIYPLHLLQSEESKVEKEIIVSVWDCSIYIYNAVGYIDQYGSRRGI